MKYVVTICSIVLGMTLAGVGARADKLRLAQELTVPKCVAICNSNGFSCAKNCGLSGACVAQCNTGSAACINKCDERK
jgi:hypothetical protein